MKQQGSTTPKTLMPPRQLLNLDIVGEGHIWPLISSNPIRYWAIVLSITFLILGVVDSKLLSPLKDYWIKLGEILGKVIAPLVMSLVFFIILTPIGLILRIFGKDLLKLKKNKKSSYWLSRGDLKSMDRQF